MDINDIINHCYKNINGMLIGIIKIYIHLMIKNLEVHKFSESRNIKLK